LKPCFLEREQNKEQIDKRQITEQRHTQIAEKSNPNIREHNKEKLKPKAEL